MRENYEHNQLSNKVLLYSFTLVSSFPFPKHTIKPTSEDFEPKNKNKKQKRVEDQGMWKESALLPILSLSKGVRPVMGEERRFDWRDSSFDLDCPMLFNIYFWQKLWRQRVGKKDPIIEGNNGEVKDISWL